MGFPRQEYWTGLPFPSPGDLPNPGIEARAPALQAVSCVAGRFLTYRATWEAPIKLFKKIKMYAKIWSRHGFLRDERGQGRQTYRVLWSQGGNQNLPVPSPGLSGQLLHLHGWREGGWHDPAVSDQGSDQTTPPSCGHLVPLADSEFLILSPLCQFSGCGILP